MRRQNIDYSGTRSSDGTRSLSPKRNFFVHEAKNYRLLRYSTFGRDKLPISQKDSHIRDNNQSTTTVLDSIRDKISTSQEELLIHEMTTSRLLRTRPKRTPIKGVITQEDEDLSTTIVLHKEGSSIHETIKNLDYHGTRTTMTHENRLPQYSKKQIKTDKGNQPIGRQLKRKYYTSECRKYCSRHPSTQKPKEFHNNCSSLWRRLQATNNPISNGLHLRDILRELLLRTANGNPITNRGQVCGGEKGLN